MNPSRSRATVQPALGHLLRQGDVLLISVPDMPMGATPVAKDAGRIVLAYGEVTGHAHVVREAADLFEASDARYLRVLAPVPLEHEEHAPIPLAPGTYRVVIQREYIPDAVASARWRPVVD